VPSSDTNPSMDPAESKKYTERETQGSTPVPQSSGSSQGQGRDASDMKMGGQGGGGGSSSSSSTRSSTGGGSLVSMCTS
jgi:hypothetical protein